ncbi:hypothetical protein INT45_002313 [Circinella minor]|uniref:Uncharacterized protein n=1 Tax=Circinella minor TaxID=1195481 RepID=A0A8H7RUF6_9FUNG|nr:hypothetical protein INT45_002313 [Circinella minor]
MLFFLPGKIEIDAMSMQLKEQGLKDGRYRYNEDGTLRANNFSNLEMMLTEVSCGYGKTENVFANTRPIPPLPPTPSPAPTPRNTLMQPGLQRVIRTRDIEIFQRVIAPVGRSRRNRVSTTSCHSHSAPISRPNSAPMATYNQPVATSAPVGSATPAVSAAPGVNGVSSVGGHSVGAKVVRSVGSGGSRSVVNGTRSVGSSSSGGGGVRFGDNGGNGDGGRRSRSR